MSWDILHQGLQHPGAFFQNTAHPKAQGVPSTEPWGSQEVHIKSRLSNFW